MSKYFSKKFSSLVPYTPGEQPKDRKFIKLNTNESPFPPSERVIAAASKEAESLQLYSDPEVTAATLALAELYGVGRENVILTNGSDEVLYFAFMAFADESRPMIFPDITYGFYKVFADLIGTPYSEIPLTDDLRIDSSDYVGKGKTVVIANPNAPTGIALPLSVIEKIVASNPDNVVIIDEAYVDFGGESAIPLTKKYKNLLVTGTFSKSRSLAGARLGFGIGDSALISDLMTLKYSTNPYNVNRMTAAAGHAAILDNGYYMDNCKRIIENREYTARELSRLGFSLTDSRANFVFARSPEIGGDELYRELRQLGILVRHFSAPRICEYNRITVGTREEMEALIAAVEAILKEKRGAENGENKL